MTKTKVTTTITLADGRSWSETNPTLPPAWEKRLLRMLPPDADLRGVCFSTRQEPVK